MPNNESSTMHNMRFITGVQYAKSMLKALNSITFIFDPNWKIGNTDVPTFPVCFFHVKNQHEIMESEISQKTLLFYNDSSEQPLTGLQGAMTNVVADNIVVKPKTYKLDIMIPFALSALLTDNYMLSSINGVSTTLATGMAKTSSGLNKFQGYTNYVVTAYEILKTLIINQLTVSYNTNAQTVVDTIVSTPDYNKNSLEMMWRNRSILKMKVWNSWKYKYVAITNLDISKEPTEDNVYEATMTVQEVPIMTFKKKKEAGQPTSVYNNKLLENSGNKVITWLNEKETKV